KSDPEHADAIRPVVESLRDLLRAESDDWLTNRLLDSLLLYDFQVLSPLFLDALEDRSPNVRWQAIKWFGDGDHRDPEARPALEEAWRRETRPWIRAALVTALANQGSTEQSGDFLRLAASDDLLLATAAIEALGTLHDPEAIPVLAKIARQNQRRRQVAALVALRKFPDSPEALEAVLKATRSETDSVRAVAVAALAAFQDQAATERLIEIVRGEKEVGLRVAAVGALDGAQRHPETVPALLEVLREAPTENGAWLQSRTIRTLHNLDDPSAIPGLRDLDPGPGGDDDDSVAGLILYLSRERSDSFNRHTIIVGTSCSFGSPVDPEDPESFVVAPPPGAHSIRCWERPGVAGDPEDYPRLPAGQAAHVTDYFEKDDDLWVEVEGRGLDDCWVLPQLLWKKAAADAPEEDRDALLRREFDLRTAELDSEAARQLLDRGLIEVIDPSAEVAGVALTVDPADARQVALLAQAYRSGETGLDKEILKLIGTLARLYGGDESLTRLLESAPATEDETEEID
ncbi:MAG TPA: HEAT repeat domain-containing protein, partial [Candidatus Polarisedimenticolia bacterium]|nr:HEAT repeat domain-containing protein [Candidatus Polarisedimenticolia bacterium]